MVSLSDLTTPNVCNWCPGCGDFGIWAAFKNACVQEGWDNFNTCMVAGIGCHGHIVNFLKLSSFEGLHGRPLPVASGIKLANHRLNVVVFTGDGDCLAEGGNHFIHAARRNHDITVILHDNAVYGLTTGQTSPASPEGYKSKSTPGGNPDPEVNPAALAIASGATFVARGYAGDIPCLTELMVRAVRHKGFSLVDVLQPCVTFNKLYTHEFFRANTYKLPEGFDVTNKFAAFEKAHEWGEKKIPLGVLYEVDLPTQESKFPQLSEKPLVEQTVEKRDLGELMKGYM